MDASLFSWSGLIISLLVVAAILAVAFILVRGVVRFIQRRTRHRANGGALDEGRSSVNE